MRHGKKTWTGQTFKPDFPLHLQTPLLLQQQSHKELEPLNRSPYANLIVDLQGSAQGLHRAGCCMARPLDRRKEAL